MASELCIVIKEQFCLIQSDLISAFETHDLLDEEDVKAFCKNMEGLWQTENFLIKQNPTHYRDEISPSLLTYWFISETTDEIKKVIAIFILGHFSQSTAQEDRNAKILIQFFNNDLGYSDEDINKIYKSSPQSPSDTAFINRLYIMDF